MIIDRFNIKEHLKQIYSMFPETKQNITIFKIQNIVRYYFEGTSQEEWELDKDFPNCVLPWPWLWMEWKPPLFSNSDGKIIDRSFMNGSELGVLAASKKIDNGWHLELHCFMYSPVMKYKSHWCSVKFVLDRNGVIKIFKDNNGRCKFIHIAGRDLVNRVGEKDLWGVTLSEFIFPCLLAISFCHCKNIIIDKKNIDEKLIRIRRKKNKIHILKYYTLNIEPIKKILDESTSESQGLKNAIHICRGHFKDFRNSGGLFGKHKGLYWWDMQARGRDKKREVIKDYSVLNS